MSHLIKGFTSVNEEEFLNLANDKGGVGKLENQDTYRKPEPIRPNHTIDVVRDFSWYSGGSMTDAVFNRIPKVMLVEYDQTLNSQISQAIYYLRASLEDLQSGVDNTSKFISKFSKYVGVDESDVKKISGSIVEGLQKLNDKVKGFGVNESEAAKLKANYLNSIAGIYLTEPTKFSYSLPYFEKPPNIQNDWSSPDNNGMIGDILNTGMEIVEQVQSFVNITQPGIYIQKAKSYHFSESGPSLTIRFPLFNTVRRGGNIPYQQNYELLWLLTYQNKPYKTAFARAKPPKIYDVTIPGLVNMPYAHIRSMTVEFAGTVRNKQITIPGVGSFTAPIPDAYDVTIEIESLLSDYANLMIGSGFGATIAGNTATITNTNDPPQTDDTTTPKPNAAEDTEPRNKATNSASRKPSEERRDISEPLKPPQTRNRATNPVRRGRR